MLFSLYSRTLSTWRDLNFVTPKFKNPCEFGKVRFQGNCNTLNGEEACKEYQKIIGRKVHLVVDPTSLQLACLDEDGQDKCANNCCIGSSRYRYCNKSAQQ